MRELRWILLYRGALFGPGVVTIRSETVYALFWVSACLEACQRLPDLPICPVVEQTVAAPESPGVASRGQEHTRCLESFAGWHGGDSEIRMQQHL